MPKINKIQIKSQPLQAYQSEVYFAIQQYQQDSIFTILSPRQMGKSYLIEMILLDASINHPNQVSIVIEPTLAQSRKMANEMYNMIVDTPAFKAYNSQLLQLTMSNGSSILFKSVEQGSIALRGYTISKFGYLIIDEAAFADDDLFYNATPLTSRYQRPIICFSTPRFEDGFFYDYCNSDNENVHFFDWSKYKNPYISDEKLKMLEKSMPQQLFLAEYKAVWMRTNSDVFGQFDVVMNNAYDNSIDERVMGVDWGAGKAAKSDDSDYTAVSIMNGERQQIHLEQWNDLDETKTISKIVDIAAKWKVKKMIVETNSIGNIYLGLLKKEVMKRGLRIQIVEFNTTNDSKNELVFDLQVNIQNKTVQLLNDNILKLQMMVYQQQRTNSGKVTFNAAAGQHDDALMATMLSLFGLKKSHSIIR